MMKSSTSFGFSSSLLFFLFIVASIAACVRCNTCQYRLYVRTGNIADAGTDSRIGVTISNTVGESIEIPNLLQWGTISGDGYDYFENGNEDQFLVHAPCTKTPLCKITVTSDGSGQKPGWYLGYVRFADLSPETPESFYDIIFMFNQWLAIDEPPYKLTASRALSFC